MGILMTAAVWGMYGHSYGTPKGYQEEQQRIADKYRRDSHNEYRGMIDSRLKRERAEKAKVANQPTSKLKAPTPNIENKVQPVDEPRWLTEAGDRFSKLEVD